MSPRSRSRRRHHEPPVVTLEELRSWFAGNLPDDWFIEPAEVRFDREEIVVIGRMAEPKVAGDDDPALAAAARIAAFREDTREQRMAIADRAQTLFQRHVSWAAACGDHERSFTTASIPVRTRLGMEERAILDTLIEAGVARSRSEALAWCVRLVADNEAGWLAELRDAMADLAALRDQGPDSTS